MENATFNTSVEPFGIGLPYPEPLRIILIILEFVCVLIGVPGNLMIIITILRFRHLRVRLNMFIVNLALSDLVFTGYLLPFILADNITGRYPVGPKWCMFNALVSQTALSGGFLSIVLIAVTRYLKVCKTSLYDKIFSKKVTTFLCILSWGLGLLLAIYLMTKPSLLKYSRAAHMCTVDTTKTPIFAWISTLLKLPPAYLASFWCYWKIWRHVQESGRKLRNHGNETFSRLRHNVNQCVFQCNFVIFLLFVLLQTPFAFIVVAVPNSPVSLYGICSFLFVANSSVNFIIYGAMNKNIRNTYRNVIPVPVVRQVKDQFVSNIELTVHSLD